MQENTQKICESVLKMVTPAKGEKAKIWSLAQSLEEKVAIASEYFYPEIEVRLEGSVAKDTWISREPDIDIFIQLPSTIPRKSLGKIGLKIARKATEGFIQVERFAEHPYLESEVDNTQVNIVPCYKTKQGEWLSATDRTPFHTNYIKKHMTEELKDEIRLLKKFMKGIHAYGAEIKVGGFSGYLCELLVLHYKSFIGTLSNFAQQEKSIIIDIEGHYKENKDKKVHFFKEPLVVIDPVDKKRNVASPVKPQKLYTFIAAARTFLANPSIQFFYPPETTLLTVEHLKRELKIRGTAIIFVKFGKVNAVPDVLWGQLYKSQRSMCQKIQRESFKILRSFSWSDEVRNNMFIFELEQRFTSPVKQHIGPPLRKRMACRRFLEKHTGNPNTVSGPYIAEGKWVVDIIRRYTDVVELLKEMLKDGGRKLGVAEKISVKLREEFEILVNDEIVGIYEKNTEFAKFLTDFLSGKPKWLSGYKNQ